MLRPEICIRQNTPSTGFLITSFDIVIHAFHSLEKVKQIVSVEHTETKVILLRWLTEKHIANRETVKLSNTKRKQFRRFAWQKQVSRFLFDAKRNWNFSSWRYHCHSENYLAMPFADMPLASPSDIIEMRPTYTKQIVGFGKFSLGD